MNIYHIWAQLKTGVSDIEFVKSVQDYLGAMRDKGHLESYRVTRRKLGLGMEELLDFHIMSARKNSDPENDSSSW